jgi:predicted MFS family arabinose efflux permease
LLDRIDRKHGLLWLYLGFTVATLACAVAPSYPLLLVGRALAGAFGGVVAASVLAVIGDAYPDRRRGTATGVVMSAFSIASIVGIPAGLSLAHGSKEGWRTPFYVLAASSAVVLVGCWFAIPPLRHHLEGDHPRPRLVAVISHPPHLRAYLLMFCMVLTTFCVVPYIAAFLVKNVGVSDLGLKLVYFVGGLATVVTMNVFGRLADRFSRLWLFRLLTLAALVPIVTLTYLPPGTPLVWVLVTTTLMMVLTSGRMVPAMALITGVAAPRERGSFLSVNTAVQQGGAGVAPFLASLFLGDGERGGPIEGFPSVGWLSVGWGLLSLVLVGLLRPAPGAPPPAEEAIVQVEEVPL